MFASAKISTTPSMAMSSMGSTRTAKPTHVRVVALGDGVIMGSPFLVVTSPGGELHHLVYLSGW